MNNFGLRVFFRVFLAETNNFQFQVTRPVIDVINGNLSAAGALLTYTCQYQKCDLIPIFLKKISRKKIQGEFELLSQQSKAIAK